MTWFSRLRNWQTDQANGIGIRADYHDSEDDNFASGINNSLNIAGGNSPTSNIAMAGYKFTGAADGTAASDFATLKQAQINSTSYAVDSSGTDAYAITLSPALTAYTTGMVVRFYPGTINTGACSLNVNGLGAKSIKKDKNTDPADGDIVVGQLVEVIYDGTNFQLLSPTYGLIAQNQGSIYGVDAGGSDSYAISLAPALTAYPTGMVIRFKPNTKNTGACSLNVNSLGAKSIKKDYNADPADGDIAANQILSVIYDGTNFQMLSPIYGVVGQNGQSIYAEDTGSTDDYVITLSPAPSAYATGMVVNFKANTLNTGSATLNVNSLGAKTIKKFGTTNNLITGDILAGQRVSVLYDGTNFQMLSCVDDIVNLTTDSTPDLTADYVKTYDASATTYKKVLLQNVGVYIQQQITTSTSTASSTTQIPPDDTIPQITEGTEYFNVSITPKNANNILEIEVFLPVIGASASIYWAGALFQDSTANALVASILNIGASGFSGANFALKHRMTAGTTSATTFRFRHGPGSAATTYIGRDNSVSAYFSTSRIAYIKVTERGVIA